MIEILLKIYIENRSGKGLLLEEFNPEDKDKVLALIDMGLVVWEPSFCGEPILVIPDELVLSICSIYRVVQRKLKGVE
ncbi:MAG: hypothetical protein M0R80_09860 [Proteobacteria bacterium]|jgi:hypothetical protein|nr:hypothetical protein [Pseudomonadota bacterium]